MQPKTKLNPDQVSHENHDNELRLTHPRLFNSYSVVDLAIIAAGCNEPSIEQRVYAAIELLMAAECAAMETPHRLMAIAKTSLNRTGPNTDTVFLREVQNSKAHHLNYFNSKQRITSIIDSCDRDVGTQQIKRTSLVTECLKALEFPHNPKYVESTFSDFCKDPDGENDERKKELLGLEVGTKTKLFKSELAAEITAIQLVAWLENRKRRSTESSLKKTKSPKGQTKSGVSNSKDWNMPRTRKSRPRKII